MNRVPYYTPGQIAFFARRADLQQRLAVLGMTCEATFSRLTSPNAEEAIRELSAGRLTPDDVVRRVAANSGSQHG